jgi:hypothetical protein
VSNQTLIARIESGLENVKADKISARTFADIVRNNGRPLEAMPYVLIQEMETLALNLEIAEWYDEDGFSPELEPLLAQTGNWLTMLPRNV